MKKILSIFLISQGIIFVLFGGYLLYLRQAPVTLSFNIPPTTVNSIGYTHPKSIQIPSVDINLPVVPAVIKNGDWETTSNGVSYLQSSPLPGQKGNSVMYGHNWSTLLGDLTKVKPGQKVFVTMNNNEKRAFLVEYTAVVSPNQTYIIDNTNDVRLTLYTCTGFLDSKRFVVVAKPVILDLSLANE